MKKFLAMCRGSVHALPRSVFLFAPAVFFVFLSMMTLLAPNVTVFLLASLLMFVGIMFGVVAWKLIELKQRVRQFMEQFHGNVVIQSLEAPSQSARTDFFIEDKHIIIH